MGNRERRRGGPGAAIAATALSIFAVAAVVLAVQGVLAFQDREQSPPPPADVTTTVRTHQLVDTVSADARIVAGATWTVEGNGIVTRAGVRAGVAISNGGLVSVLDERPLFLMSGTIPMYRELGPGATGDDVKQLQASLAALGYYRYDADGKYEKGTARAVYDFYLDRGFSPVDTSGGHIDSSQKEATSVPAAELTFAAGGSAIPVNACGDAAQKVAGPLCELRSPGTITVISVDTADVGRVAEGQRVDVVLGSEKIHGTIGARFDTGASGDGNADDPGGDTGSTPTDDKNAAPKDDIVEFTVEHEQQITATAGTTGKASIVVETSAEKALVVDAVAIREDNDGQLWLQKADDHARITVAPGICLRGLCVVEGEGLSDGLQVVVPVPGGTTKNDSDAP